VPLLEFGILAVLLVAGVVLASWWSSRRVARRIAPVTQALHLLASKGDLTARVPESRSGPRETRNLSAGFNAATGHVEEMYHALEKVLIQQRRFISDASHELRTPLTTIKGTLEAMVLLPEMDEGARAKITVSAFEESKRMYRLVEGLLALATFDSGGQITRRSLRWNELLSTATTYAEQKLGARTMTQEIAPDLGSIWGDPAALHQMFEIIIDNLADHTPETATARLMARASGEEIVEVTIEDTGPGVRAKLLPDLTTRFVRADDSRAGGKAGLGLAIAQAIAAAHGGTLRVEAVKPHGLRVIATIPRGKPRARPDRRRAPRPKIQRAD
jgi:two-component system OmpR family sensor kinase